jgi:hypothetical protein
VHVTEVFATKRVIELKHFSRRQAGMALSMLSTAVDNSKLIVFGNKLQIANCHTIQTERQLDEKSNFGIINGKAFVSLQISSLPPSPSSLTKSRAQKRRESFVHHRNDRQHFVKHP